MHEVEDLVPQTLRLHLVVTPCDQRACDCDVEMHDAGDVVRIDDAEVALIGCGEGSQALLLLVELLLRQLLTLSV